MQSYDMLSRFHLIPERNGQTDRQTDRFAMSISVCWRAVKMMMMMMMMMIVFSVWERKRAGSRPVCTGGPAFRRIHEKV